MPIDPKNARTLIRELLRTPLLDGRFESITVIGRDPVTGRHNNDEGALSVVFKAYDRETRKTVALKFFDPDILSRNPYRERAFERECELLHHVKGSERYLQLVKPLTELPLSVSDNEDSLQIICRYFATEWLDKKIDMPFNYADKVPALNRLNLFREMVLAVFALHRIGIYHRDLKPDNFGVADRESGRMVIAIDFGTAFLDGADGLRTPGAYPQQVGALGYAPLEAICGLSGVHELGVYTDIYALGCLLYELFAGDLYCVELFESSGYTRCEGLCKSHMMRAKRRDVSDLLAEWNAIIERAKRQVILPRLVPGDHPVPPGSVDRINELVHSLTTPDYRERRVELEYIIRRIDSIRRIISNERADSRARELRRQRRLAHNAKMARRNERLEEFLKAQAVLEAPK